MPEVDQEKLAAARQLMGKTPDQVEAAWRRPDQRWGIGPVALMPGPKHSPEEVRAYEERTGSGGVTSFL